MNRTDGTKVLVRSGNGRMVAGICAGTAEYFGWDLNLVRVIVAVVAVISGGAGAWPTWRRGPSSRRRARSPRSPRT